MINQPAHAQYDGTPEDRQFALEHGQRLLEAWETHKDAFDAPEVHGFSISRLHVTWPDDAPRLRAAIENVESRYDALTETTRPLGERFGETPAEVSNAFNRLKTDADGGSRSDVAQAYRGVMDGMERVAQFRKDVTLTALMDVQNMIIVVQDKFRAPEQRVKDARRIKTVIQEASWFDPHNPDVNMILANIDAFIDETAEGMQEEIAAGEFPTASGPTQHTQAALEFFRNAEQWGAREGSEVLRVWVGGPWVVTEKDLLGRPIQWGLPVYVAEVQPHLREMGAARIFETTVLARQGSPAPQAPPFVGAWVGDNWLVSLDKFGQ
ncbi:MAG TPA: hypothetical protein VKP65_11225 [Rhodothermales bacterium]|nr:hypothetical protein [Rhodothermales bacterium]